MTIPDLPRTADCSVDTLYEGPLDDVYATAVRNCDPQVRSGQLCGTQEIGRG